MKTKIKKLLTISFLTRTLLYLAICFLFFYLRFSHLRYMLHSPVAQIPIIDSLYYLQWAERLLAGLGFGPNPFFMSPLYPVFIAIAGKFFASPIYGILVFQILISFVTFTLIARFTSKRFGKWAGLCAGFLYTIYAPAIYFDGVLLSASLILLFSMIILTLLDRVFESNKYLWLWLSLTGLAIGLSALARPNALILIPAFALVFFFRNRRGVIANTLWLTLGVLIVVLPPMIRNAKHGSGLSLTTSSAGINFYIGNHENATGLYFESPFLTSAEPLYEAEDYRREALRLRGKEMSVNSASRFWGKEGLRDIVKNPFRWLKLELMKAAYFWNKTEIPNNVSFYGAKEHSPLLYKLKFFSFGLIAPFGLIGIWLYRKSPFTFIPIALIAGYFVASLIFFVSSEYRYAIIGILIAYAVGGVFQIVKLFRQNDPVVAVQSLTASFILVIACNTPWPLMKQISKPETDFFNWASISFKNNDLTNASLLFLAALAHDPTFQEAHVQLALVFDEMGLPREADKEYNEAGISRDEVAQIRYYEMMAKSGVKETTSNEIEVMDVEQLLGLGVRLSNMGRYEAAIPLLYRATEIDSLNEFALFEYGMALESIRYYSSAIKVFRRLEKLNDYDPNIPFRIAWCTFKGGDPGTARSILGRAAKKIDKMPDNEVKERWHRSVSQSRNEFFNY
jgi:tetratricopeptide (TPR) repeat protein